ncbi:MAG: 4-alpha-glucanotransferase [Candidatus Cloacimonetes bacterium]|nr:4-alpha-glucanotransferase [Candidatus Cloacimonadota bacterium]
MVFSRTSGIFLHITSLPNREGIGTFGKEAIELIKFLSSAGQKYWQICPLGPTGYGDSPYQTFSAFAGNPLLISLESLVTDGLLQREELSELRIATQDKVDYGYIIPIKNLLLKSAFSKFDTSSTEFREYCQKEDYWLDDFSRFMAYKHYFGGVAWIDWDEEIKLRKQDSMNLLDKKLKQEIELEKFKQFVLHKQWKNTKTHAHENQIEIIGDLPIFVAFDSADAWANPAMFDFDENHRPKTVAGVPPDYFSNTGQLWGNPIYNWKYLRETHYEWWLKRFRKTLEWVDVIRIDHFRGFESYWAVPYGEATAVNGSWKPAPGQELFSKVQKELGELPIIAEDLGVITPEVEKLRDSFGYPGMKILQFAFDSGDSNPYLPHNYIENCIVYTGTHDNDTTEGWYAKLKTDVKKYVDEYTKYKSGSFSRKLIETAWNSNAVLAIAPLQDFLALPSEARLNTPGKADGNWQWRYRKEDLKEELSTEIQSLTLEAKRLNK